MFSDEERTEAMRKSAAVNNYEDIINLPHPTSSKHPRMPVSDRAAQFSPFAALTGHGAAIEETARLTDRYIEIDEERQRHLNEKIHLLLQYLHSHRGSSGPEVTITYFIPDEKKNGGAYCTTAGNIKKIDEYSQTILLADDARIDFSCLYDLEGNILEDTSWMD